MLPVVEVVRCSFCHEPVRVDATCPCPFTKISMRTVAQDRRLGELASMLRLLQWQVGLVIALALLVAGYCYVITQ